MRTTMTRGRRDGGWAGFMFDEGEGWICMMALFGVGWEIYLLCPNHDPMGNRICMLAWMDEAMIRLFGHRIPMRKGSP